MTAVSYTDGVLTIRPQSVEDLDQSLAGIDDAQMDWLWDPGDRELWESMGPAEQREHQRRHLERVSREFGPGPKWCFSGDLRDARFVVYVDCDLANPNVPAGEANISYTTHPAYRGRGYAGRAVRLVCRFLADRTPAERAHLLVDPGNESSARVARAVGAIEAGWHIDRFGRRLTRWTLPVVR